MAILLRKKEKNLLFAKSCQNHPPMGKPEKVQKWAFLGFWHLRFQCRGPFLREKVHISVFRSFGLARDLTEFRDETKKKIGDRHELLWLSKMRLFCAKKCALFSLFAKLKNPVFPGGVPGGVPVFYGLQYGSCMGSKKGSFLGHLDVQFYVFWGVFWGPI